MYTHKFHSKSCDSEEMTTLANLPQQFCLFLFQPSFENGKSKKPSAFEAFTTTRFRLISRRHVRRCRNPRRGVSGGRELLLELPQGLMRSPEESRAVRRARVKGELVNLPRQDRGVSSYEWVWGEGTGDSWHFPWPQLQGELFIKERRVPSGARHWGKNAATEGRKREGRGGSLCKSHFYHAVATEDHGEGF